MYKNKYILILKILMFQRASKYFIWIKMIKANRHIEHEQIMMRENICKCINI